MSLFAHIQAIVYDVALVFAQAQTPKPEPESVTEAVKETVEAAMTWSDSALEFLTAHILTQAVGIQVAIVFAAGLLALALRRPTKMFMDRVWPNTAMNRFSLVRTGIEKVIIPFFWVLFLWAATSAMKQSGLEYAVVRSFANLLNAYVLIRLFSILVRDSFWSNAFAILAWLVAALNILGLLDPTVKFLDSFAIQIGDSRLSLYVLLKGVVFASLLLWLAIFLSRIINTRIYKTSVLTPSAQTLIGQSVRLGLLFGAVMIALSTIGVDLTALAVFSGAVGVGVGFGLQSVFSNLVAGIILLFERSIRVGDFVELADGIQGTVREITIRSTLVTTNDNIDVLVPNSEFITKQMTNWTLRDAFRRLRIPFGVAYGTDKELVKKAGLEAAAEVEHTLLDVTGRKPAVWLVGFGDSSLDFELVVWLKSESVTRPGAVHAAYCWAIESALGRHGIEIPFPQRDLHIRTGLRPEKQ